MPDEKRVFTPNTINELFTGWLIHSHKARDRHDAAARHYANAQFWLGVPALLVSTLVGTTVFAALSSRETPPLWVAVLSVLAAVLTALQTFMDFAGRSDKHRNAAVKYKVAIRLFEETLVQLGQGKEPVKDEIDAARTMLDGLEETAPVIMSKFYDAIEKRYRDMQYVSEAIGLYTKPSPLRQGN